MASLDLGEVENIVDDPQQRRPPSSAPCPVASRCSSRRVRRALQDIDHAQHAVHRRPDLVAHRWPGRSTSPGWRFSASRCASRARRGARQTLVVVRRPAAGARGPPSRRPARCCRTASGAHRAHGAIEVADIGGRRRCPPAGRTAHAEAISTSSSGATVATAKA